MEVLSNGRATNGGAGGKKAAREEERGRAEEGEQEKRWRDK